MGGVLMRRGPWQQVVCVSTEEAGNESLGGCLLPGATCVASHSRRLRWGIGVDESDPNAHQDVFRSWSATLTLSCVCMRQLQRVARNLHQPQTLIKPGDWSCTLTSDLCWDATFRCWVERHLRRSLSSGSRQVVLVLLLFVCLFAE